MRSVLLHLLKNVAKMQVKQAFEAVPKISNLFCFRFFGVLGGTKGRKRLKTCQWGELDVPDLLKASKTSGKHKKHRKN